MKQKIEDAVRKSGGVWPKRLLSKGSIGVMLWLDSDGGITVCTRTEFEECARRLRNEPSFDAHPDAKCFVQNDNGRWHKNTNTTNVAPYNGGNWRSQDDGYGWLFVQTGEVIGDWRDTLRLRPEEKKVDRCKKHDVELEFLGGRGAHPSNLYCPVCDKEKEEIYEKRNNREDKNDWHAKGELPPAGTVCRRRFATAAEIVVTITYVGDGVLCYRDENGIECSVESSYVEFLPLQTERERLIERAARVVKDPRTPGDAVKLLTDAGILKMPEDK